MLWAGLLAHSAGNAAGKPLSDGIAAFQELAGVQGAGLQAGVTTGAVLEVGDPGFDIFWEAGLQFGEHALFDMGVAFGHHGEDVVMLFDEPGGSVAIGDLVEGEFGGEGIALSGDEGIVFGGEADGGDADIGELSARVSAHLAGGAEAIGGDAALAGIAQHLVGEVVNVAGTLEAPGEVFLGEAGETVDADDQPVREGEIGAAHVFGESACFAGAQDGGEAVGRMLGGEPLDDPGRIDGHKGNEGVYLLESILGGDEYGTWETILGSVNRDDHSIQPGLTP